MSKRDPAGDCQGCQGGEVDRGICRLGVKHSMYLNGHVIGPFALWRLGSGKTGVWPKKVEVDVTWGAPPPPNSMDLDGSTSPAGGPMALLATAENLTGLVLDGDEVPVFVKEETTSPVSDISRSSQVSSFKYKPKAPPRTSGASGGNRTGVSHHHSGKSGRHGSKAAAAAKAAALRGPHPSPHPVVPRRIEDWDPWKGLLHELYITQNRILRDIIQLMETNYNLKATPKMYKNQFARWGFFKYAVKRRPRYHSDESPTDDSYDGNSSSPSTITLSRNNSYSTSSPILFGNNSSRATQLGLTAIRRFLHGYIDLDISNLQLEEVAGYIDPCYRYFKASMDLFDLKENTTGGQVLRLAFLQIERKLEKPTMKSFSDLCFVVPHLLLESGRLDILKAYFRYLARLTNVKFGNHPVSEIAASFVEMFEEGSENEERLMGYIQLLSQVNADVIEDIPGVLGRTREWARNQSLACQQREDRGRSRSRSDSPTSIGSPLGNMDNMVISIRDRDKKRHHMLRVEAQSVYWAQKLVMSGDPESNALAEQWLNKEFGQDFKPRVKALLARLKMMRDSGLFPEVFAKMMECLFIGWLFDYCEYVEEWEEAFEWGRKGLALSANEQYVIWSIHIEGVMREHGSVAEADALKKKRQEMDWMEQVRAQVEKLTL
ncbi:hypothetical protein B0T21DRAFT_396174 [Apiosordaria backusii]|uniref:Clr5 domain-containing protein n=1 Tax=Apiosordaria backusii TaxID=314023 RepID=A0AA40DYW1_9PEZI|nr:hypothetical protein B0T21DRAFT_396174 [Apiosordaria backusii]